MGFINNLWVKLGLKNDDFVKGLNRATSKTTSFSNQAGKAIGGLAAKFLSLTAAIAAVGKTLADAVRTIANFERANSTLASVLGTNKKGIVELSKAAIELGRSTEFTASQVTELQTELARLGFSKDQILASERAVLMFAQATGSELGEAAGFAGAALRAFGLDAGQMGNMLDIMAASTSKSALSFEKLNTSIGIVAPIAKSFGLDVKQTAAMLGVLSNNGFDASSAATALRNILLYLADSNSKLNKGIGHSVTSFDDMIEAFKQLKADGVGVNEVLQMTDKRSASAATTLISNADAVRDLANELAAANGTLNEMAGTMNDNLIGSVRNLASAWEGLILQFRESSGPLKTAVDWVTKLVNGFTQVKVLSGMTEEEGAKYLFDKAFERAANSPNNLASQFPASDQSEGYTVVTTTNPSGDSTPKASTTASKMKDELARIHEEQEALNAETREYDALWEKAADDFHKYSDLPPIKPFDNDYIATAAHNFKLVTDELDRADAEAKQLQEDIDAAFNEAFDKLTKGSFEMGDLISGVLTAAIQGFSDCVQELANGLMQVGELDSSALTKALLDPLCDMAKQMGEVMMTMAAGMIAVKTSISNPYLLLAAGAALVAIGAAGKAALASITAGGSTSSAAGTTSTSTAGGAAENMEMTIHIEGKLKGSDIVLAGQRTQMAWGR